MDDRIPPFLTVEEASRLLKIGRTKAYLLTKEWRATGGRSGLPVVDLGDVLRVPGPAIERMLGTGLGAVLSNLEKPAGKAAGPAAAPAAAPHTTSEGTCQAATAETKPSTAGNGGAPAPVPAASSSTRRPRRRPIDQFPLFQPLTPTNPDPQTPTPDDPEPTTHP